MNKETQAGCGCMIAIAAVVGVVEPVVTAYAGDTIVETLNHNYPELDLSSPLSKVDMITNIAIDGARYFFTWNVFASTGDAGLATLTFLGIGAVQNSMVIRRFIQALDRP